MLMETRTYHNPLMHLFLLRCWVIPLLGVMIASACHAQDRIISVNDSAAQPGTQTQVEIHLSELQGFAGGDFAIGFDPSVISILDVNKAPETSDFFLAYGLPTTGRVSISMAAAMGLVTSGTGTIATLEVRLADNAASGSLSVFSMRTARWYDDMSVRHTLLGDNGLLAVNQSPPGNEHLTLTLGSDEGHAGSTISLSLTSSMGHSMGKLSGDFTFDPLLLSFMDLELSPNLEGWSRQITLGAGTVHFNMSSSTECSDPLDVEIGTISFAISEGAVPATTTTLGLTGTRISNLEGFSYSHLDSGGSVKVLVQAESTPTPTTSPTTEATPTPTGIPGELHPADFNGDGIVDQTDLNLFLETWHMETVQ